jgi:hypothetical protein
MAAAVPAGRFRRWGSEEWRVFLAAFPTLGSLTAAGVAVYGVFFTSISEVSIRQLRAEVANAKEELSSLSSSDRCWCSGR